MGDHPRPDPLLDRVAAAVLDLQREPGPVTVDEPDAHRFARLLAAAREQRVVGLLAAAVATGALPATASQATQVHADHRAAMAAALLLDRDLLEVTAGLRAAGIDHRVLKGTAVAHLDYPEPSLRSYGDVDLLVLGGRITDAAADLMAAGAVRYFPERRKGFDRRFTKSVTLRRANGREVDLHRTVAAGPFGACLDPGALAARPERVVVGGTELLTLRRPARFLHACYHAVLGRAEVRLGPLLDLALAAPETAAEVDDVDEFVRSAQAGAVVRHAVGAATARLGWSPPTGLDRWLRSLVVPRRQVRWLAAYTGAGRSNARQAVHTLEVLPMRERAAYAAAIVATGRRRPGPRPGE